MLVIDQGALRFHGTTHAGVNFVEAKLNNLMTTDLSFLTGTVIEKNDTYHLTTLDVAGQRVQIPQSQYRNLQTGDQVTLNIKTSDVALALAQPSGISIRNILQGVITNIAATERFTDITLTIGDQTLRSRITLAAANELKLVPGMTLYALLKSSGLS
jgi:molybdate transport system ATP-binding protein